MGSPAGGRGGRRGVGDRDRTAAAGGQDGQDEAASLAGFAAGLLRLRDDAGITSARALAARAHYSHTAVAAATGGRTLPSLPVTLAIVRACGGDPAEWEARWRALRTAIDALDFDPADAAPPWPEQPVEDGADPEQSGCSADATTVHARKVARHDSRTMVGQLELRYSRRNHAAWGRFFGFPHLDHVAREQDVRLLVGVHRASDRVERVFEVTYAFDWHYGDILLTGRGALHAFVTVLVDGVDVASGRTDARTLP